MQNIKFLPLHFTMSLVLGILFGYYFEFSIGILFVVIFVLILSLLFFHFKAKSSFEQPVLFSVLTVFGFLCIGILSVELQNSKNQKNHYNTIYSSNDQIIIKIKAVLKPSKTFQKYEAEVIQINSNKTKGTILLHIYKDSLNKLSKVDDVLLTYSPLKEINRALNPNEFDYREFLKKKGISKQLILKKGEYLPLMHGRKTVKGYAFAFRQRINTKLKNFQFSQSEIAIIDAILLGQRQEISKDLFESYKNAGAIHILAVSGLHIGIILLLFNFLFAPVERLKNGKIIKLVFVISFLWIYAFIAGMSASVVRATTMFTAIAIGWISNRPSSTKNSLILSFFFLLLIHPLFLFDVGFQLSYVAVFSIVEMQPVLSRLWKPKLKFIRYFWQLLTVSFAAQLGILPLSLYYFHQFPGLFFISSLVIIPFLGILLGFGLLVIIFALMNVLPQFLADFYGFTITAMNHFVAFVSHQKSFIFSGIFFSLLLLFAFYVLLITALNFVNKRSVKRFSYILIAFAFVQTIFIYEKFQALNTNQFIVFHQVKNSIFAVKKQNKIHFYHRLNAEKIQENRMINSYLSGVFTYKTITSTTLKNTIHYNQKLALVIDSSGIYSGIPFIPETVILTQSPKINLQRLLNDFHPKIIIADGSNYKSYINRWEKTCKKEDVNFYSTSQKGAFVANFSN